MRNKSLMDLTLINKIILLLFTGCIATVSHMKLASQSITSGTNNTNDLTQNITLILRMPKNDFIYKDFISFSVDHPLVTISSWKVNQDPTFYYDPLFKSTKQIFTKNIKLTITATAKSSFDEPAYLYCSYYQRSEKKIKQIQCPLAFKCKPIVSSNDTGEIDQKIIINKKNHGARHVTLLEHSVINIVLQARVLLQQITNASMMQLFFIILLLLFCIIPPYFFSKKLNIYSQINELTTITSYTLLFIIIGLMIYITQRLVWSAITGITTTVYTLGIGIFYIKRSTKLQWKYLSTLCNFLGGLLIALTILCLFKTIQLLSVVF